MMHDEKNSEKRKKTVPNTEIAITNVEREVFFRKRFLIFFSGSFILKMLLKVIKEIRSSFFIKLVFIMTFRAAF